MTQTRVLFAGTVQGVGFRYTACRLAGEFDVTGYVRNLPDGRVECVVEGEESEIDSFLRQLQDYFSDYIRQAARQTAPPTGRWKSFGVTY